MYYNPKLYHAASVDTAIASGKRVNYRIPGGKRSGSHPWFLSPYNKQSSLSTDGRAVGEDKYGTIARVAHLWVINLDNHGLAAGDIIDITITSGPDAGKTAHRTVLAASLSADQFQLNNTADDANFDAVTWTWTADSAIYYNCKVTL